MAQMSGNYESPSRDFGDSLQLNNWVLYSGATCHMTPHISGYIHVSLEDIYKRIKVADGHHVTAKQKGNVQIKICGDNRDTSIATLHNVFLAPDFLSGYFQLLS